MGYFLEKLAASVDDERTLGTTARGALAGGLAGGALAGGGLGIAALDTIARRTNAADRNRALENSVEKAGRNLNEALEKYKSPFAREMYVDSLIEAKRDLNRKIDLSRYGKRLEKLKRVGKVAIPASIAAGLAAGAYGLGTKGHYPGGSEIVPRIGDTDESDRLAKKTLAGAGLGAGAGYLAGEGGLALASKVHRIASAIGARREAAKRARDIASGKLDPNKDIWESLSADLKRTGRRLQFLENLNKATKYVLPATMAAGLGIGAYKAYNSGK